MTSLNPFLRISQQLMEMTRLHLGHSKSQAYEHAIKMLETVGIPDARERVDEYPHISGGMRQRVMIAMALSCKPELLIADEPSTALDVTIQAQILELIKKLKDETGTSVILITHDLGVVAGMTDHVIVMYAGKLFEQALLGNCLRCPEILTRKGCCALCLIPAASREVFTRFPVSLRTSLICHLVVLLRRDASVQKKYAAVSFLPSFNQLPNHHSLCHFATEVYEESRRERASLRRLR